MKAIPRYDLHFIMGYASEYPAQQVVAVSGVDACSYLKIISSLPQIAHTPIDLRPSSINAFCVHIGPCGDVC